MINRCQSALLLVGISLSVLCVPLNLEAKAWLNGHIVELRPDGFTLQTRFYPHITVHISADTVVRCKKQVLKASDLQPHDLVTVEGRDKRGDGIDATKITIHRDWLKCKGIKGPKPPHCAC